MHGQIPHVKTGHTGVTNPAKLQVTEKVTTFGYIRKRGKLEKLSIPSKDVQNTFLFGEVKSGKSTTIEDLIRQDVESNTGFFFLDPHKQAAINVVAAVPPEKRHKLVYISLDSPDVFGRCMQLNPFEFEDENERFFIVDSFLGMLSNHFTSDGKIGWGPRLEMILRHSLHLLVSKPGARLHDLGQILINEDVRNEFLAICPFQPARDFFEGQWEKLPPDAVTAAFNKIDQLLSTPSISMLFDCAKSTISIPEMIAQGKFVVMDLHSKVTADIANLVGSMVIHMFNVEGKRRQGKGTDMNIPFNMYIDECHSFSPSVLRELLNTIRKFGMKLTLATQTADHLDRQFAGEIPSLVQVMVCFRCTADTEMLLSRTYQIDKRQITNLSRHHFRIWAKSTPEIRGLGMTKRLPVKSFDEVRPIVAEILNRIGTKIDLNRYKPPLKTHGTATSISPVEWYILNFLHQCADAIYLDDIITGVMHRFDLTPDKVKNSIRDLGNRGFITTYLPRPDGVNTSSDMLYKYSPATRDRYFSIGTKGRRAGYGVHVDALETIFDAMTDNFHLTEVDTGDDIHSKADLLVRAIKRAPGQNKNIEARFTKLDPLNWGETFAIEVETEPSKHPDKKTVNLDGSLKPDVKTHVSQVYKNFEKNRKLNYEVCFVVFTDTAREQVKNIMSGHGIGIRNDAGIGDYSINVIPLHAKIYIDDASGTPASSDGERGDNNKDQFPNAKQELVARKAGALDPHEVLGSIRSIKPPTEEIRAPRIDDDEFKAWSILSQGVGRRGDGLLQSKGVDLLMKHGPYDRSKASALIESLRRKKKVTISGHGSSYSKQVLMVEKYVPPPDVDKKEHDDRYTRTDGGKPHNWKPETDADSDYDAESESDGDPDPALTTKIEALREEAEQQRTSDAESAQTRPGIRTETQSEAPPKIESKVEPETQSPVELETQQEIEPDVEPEIKPDVEPEIEQDVEPEIEPDVEPEIEPDVEPETQSEIKPEAESETPQNTPDETTTGPVIDSSATMHDAAREITPPPKPKKETPLPPSYPSMKTTELAALVSKSRQLDENLEMELESRGFKISKSPDGRFFIRKGNIDDAPSDPK